MVCGYVVYMVVAQQDIDLNSINNGQQVLKLYFKKTNAITFSMYKGTKPLAFIECVLVDVHSARAFTAWIISQFLMTTGSLAYIEHVQSVEGENECIHHLRDCACTFFWALNVFVFTFSTKRQFRGLSVKWQQQSNNMANFKNQCNLNVLSDVASCPILWDARFEVYIKKVKISQHYGLRLQKSCSLLQEGYLLLSITELHKAIILLTNLDATWCLVLLCHAQ